LLFMDSRRNQTAMSQQKFLEGSKFGKRLFEPIDRPTQALWRVTYPARGFSQPPYIDLPKHSSGFCFDGCHISHRLFDRSFG